MTKNPESQLAAVVVQWLGDRGWTVHQEVEAPGGRVDIVAVRDKAVWAIECKMSFGLKVLAQAQRWIPYSHMTSVAVKGSQRRDRDEKRVLRQFCSATSIGIIEVDMPKWESLKPEVNVLAVAPFHRSPKTRDMLTKYLRDEQITYAKAGNNQGKAWTFRMDWDRRIISMVRQHPGLTFKELAPLISPEDKYHSLSSIAKSIYATYHGGLHGIDAVKVGRTLRLYPCRRDHRRWKRAHRCDLSKEQVNQILNWPPWYARRDFHLTPRQTDRIVRKFGYTRCPSCKWLNSPDEHCCRNCSEYLKRPMKKQARSTRRVAAGGC